MNDMSSFITDQTIAGKRFIRREGGALQRQRELSGLSNILE
jgi:hypothetical protein